MEESVEGSERTKGSFLNTEEGNRGSGNTCGDNTVNCVPGHREINPHKKIDLHFVDTT